MSDDKEPVDEPPRPAPRRRDDSEKALGLEVARLFGLNPRAMMAPKASPVPEDEAASDDPEASAD